MLFSQRALVQWQGQNHSDLTDILCVCAEYLDILPSACGRMWRGGASALKISHNCQTAAKRFSPFFCLYSKHTRLKSASGAGKNGQIIIENMTYLRIIHYTFCAFYRTALRTHSRFNVRFSLSSNQSSTWKPLNFPADNSPNHLPFLMIINETVCNCISLVLLYCTIEQ